MGGFTHNFIPNGDLSLWDAGPVPRDMDAQVTATTITRLQRTQIMDPSTFPWIEAQNWADIRNRLDKFTYSGEDSMRATLTAAAVADGFRIYPEGINATLFTGACTRQVPVDGMPHPFSFTIAARCSVDGNLIRLRLILRSAADAVLGYWNAAVAPGGVWQAAAATNDFGMTTQWQRYGLTTDPVPQAIGGVAVENMLWQVSNGSAGAQIIDLDDFQINDLERGFSSY